MVRATVALWGGRFEGLVLCVFGVVVLWLIAADLYWQLMNPRFLWLSATAAGLLLLCGAVLLWRPVPSKPWRGGVYLLFALLLGLAAWHASVEERSAWSGGAGGLGLEYEPAEAPLLHLGGRDFTRISTAELLNLMELDRETALGTDWVLRGVVARTPELDAAGVFVLLRPLVWCCLADGVAIGFTVPWQDVTELESGQWVRVAGRVQAADGALQSQAAEARLGSFFSAVDAGWLLVPAELPGVSGVEPLKGPRVPFVFGLRDSAPFTW